jgi:hypothetical protein
MRTVRRTKISSRAIVGLCTHAVDFLTAVGENSENAAANPVDCRSTRISRKAHAMHSNQAEVRDDAYRYVVASPLDGNR